MRDERQRKEKSSRCEEGKEKGKYEVPYNPEKEKGLLPVGGMKKKKEKTSPSLSNSKGKK